MAPNPLGINSRFGPGGGGGTGSSPPEVDLSHLTEEERLMIQSVMAKAEMAEMGVPVDTSGPSSTNLPSNTSIALTQQRDLTIQQQKQQRQQQQQNTSVNNNPSNNISNSNRVVQKPIPQGFNMSQDNINPSMVTLDRNSLQISPNPQQQQLNNLETSQNITSKQNTINQMNPTSTRNQPNNISNNNNNNIPLQNQPTFAGQIQQAPQRQANGIDSLPGHAVNPSTNLIQQQNQNNQDFPNQSFQNSASTQQQQVFNDQRMSAMNAPSFVNNTMVQQPRQLNSAIVSNPSMTQQQHSFPINHNQQQASNLPSMNEQQNYPSINQNQTTPMGTDQMTFNATVGPNIGAQQEQMMVPVVMPTGGIDSSSLGAPSTSNQQPGQPNLATFMHYQPTANGPINVICSDGLQNQQSLYGVRLQGEPNINLNSHIPNNDRRVAQQRCQRYDQMSGSLSDNESASIIYHENQRNNHLLLNRTYRKQYDNNGREIIIQNFTRRRPASQNGQLSGRDSLQSYDLAGTNYPSSERYLMKSASPMLQMTGSSPKRQLPKPTGPQFHEGQHTLMSSPEVAIRPNVGYDKTTKTKQTLIGSKQTSSKSNLSQGRDYLEQYLVIAEDGQGKNNSKTTIRSPRHLPKFANQRSMSFREESSSFSGDNEDDDEPDRDLVDCEVDGDNEEDNVAADRGGSSKLSLARKQNSSESNSRSSNGTNQLRKKQQQPRISKDKAKIDETNKLLTDFKLAEQANQVMEQQQKLIKQSQELIKLQLEQQALSQELKKSIKKQHHQTSQRNAHSEETTRDAGSNGHDDDNDKTNDVVMASVVVANDSSSDTDTGNEAKRSDVNNSDFRRNDKHMEATDCDGQVVKTSTSIPKKKTRPLTKKPDLNDKDDSDDYDNDVDMMSADSCQQPGSIPNNKQNIDEVKTDKQQHCPAPLKGSGVVNKQHGSQGSNNRQHPSGSAINKNERHYDLVNSDYETSNDESEIEPTSSQARGKSTMQRTYVASRTNNSDKVGDRPNHGRGNQVKKLATQINPNSRVVGSSVQKAAGPIRRREPTGLPPSPLPVTTAIQLHQMQKHHQYNNISNRTLANSSQTIQHLRSRSVTSSPMHGNAGNGTNDQLLNDSYLMSGYATDNNSRSNHLLRLNGNHHRVASVSSRPNSPTDTQSEYGGWTGGRSRKRLPRTPVNAIPVTPSMMRKIALAKQLGGSLPKLLVPANAASPSSSISHQLNYLNDYRGSVTQPFVSSYPSSSTMGLGYSNADAFRTTLTSSSTGGGIPQLNRFQASRSSLPTASLTNNQHLRSSLSNYKSNYLKDEFPPIPSITPHLDRIIAKQSLDKSAIGYGGSSVNCATSVPSASEKAALCNSTSSSLPNYIGPISYKDPVSTTIASTYTDNDNNSTTTRGLGNKFELDFVNGRNLASLRGALSQNLKESLAQNLTNNSAELSSSKQQQSYDKSINNNNNFDGYLYNQRGRDHNIDQLDETSRCSMTHRRDEDPSSSLSFLGCANITNLKHTLDAPLEHQRANQPTTSGKAATSTPTTSTGLDISGLSRPETLREQFASLQRPADSWPYRVGSGHFTSGRSGSESGLATRDLSRLDSLPARDYDIQRHQIQRRALTSGAHDPAYTSSQQANPLDQYYQREPPELTGSLPLYKQSGYAPNIDKYPSAMLHNHDSVATAAANQTLIGLSSRPEANLKLATGSGLLGTSSSLSSTCFMKDHRSRYDSGLLPSTSLDHSMIELSTDFGRHRYPILSNSSQKTQRTQPQSGLNSTMMSPIAEPGPYNSCLIFDDMMRPTRTIQQTLPSAYHYLDQPYDDRQHHQSYPSFLQNKQDDTRGGHFDPMLSQSQQNPCRSLKENDRFSLNNPAHYNRQQHNQPLHAEPDDFNNDFASTNNLMDIARHPTRQGQDRQSHHSTLNNDTDSLNLHWTTGRSGALTKDDIISGAPKFNSIGYRFKTSNQNKYVPQTRPANENGLSRYPHPYKRILLSKNPKDRIGNGIGISIIGGISMQNLYDPINKCIVTSGAFVNEVFQTSNVHFIGDMQKGDQIIEWNGVNLCNRSNEEVQQILLSQFCDDEVELIYLAQTKANEVYGVSSSPTSGNQECRSSSRLFSANNNAINNLCKDNNKLDSRHISLDLNDDNQRQHLQQQQYHQALIDDFTRTNNPAPRKKSFSSSIASMWYK